MYNLLHITIYFYLTLQGIFMNTLLPILGPCVASFLNFSNQTITKEDVAKTVGLRGHLGVQKHKSYLNNSCYSSVLRWP